MTATQQRLEALRNRATRYELVMQHARTGQRLRLCYTARRNRRGLIDAIRANGPDLVRVTGAEDFKMGIGATATLGDWSLTFSGRTQRDAIASDAELIWFASTGLADVERDLQRACDAEGVTIQDIGDELERQGLRRR